MCDWTNLEEIMQDLTVAQRFEVPASLETFDAVGPPPFKIEEEESAEQSCYASRGGGGGGGDFVGPDLDLIQDMLNMVKENKEDQQADNPADSNDLDQHKPEYEPEITRKKIRRNVAFESIMKAKKAELSAIRPQPQDVIPSMFKKKSLNHTPHHNMEETGKNASPSQTSSHFVVKRFKPSTHASEYYTKYVHQSALREAFEEDIWARAERQMKEVELRKKGKAELVSSKESGSESAAAFSDVNLPEHRHLMPGDCIVCIVAAKHGHYF